MNCICAIDHLTDVTQWQHFLVVFKQTKNDLHSSLNHVKFSKSTKFYKNNLLQTPKTMAPQTYEEKLGVLRSYELEWTWMKLHLLTKFDVINWAMQFIIFLMRKSRKCDISKIRAHSLVGLLQSGSIWIILQLDSNSFE